MRKILVISASRAEHGLLEPIMMELQKRGDVVAQWCILTPINTRDFESVFLPLAVALEEFNPDIVLVPTDRWEMVHVAAYAFNNGFIVSQFHAGDKGDATFDEMNRYAISFLSHILFCETEEAKENLLKIGFEQNRIFVVGSTALDHIKIDESLCPNKPYDLVLLHPDTTSATATRKDLEETQKIIQHSPLVVWIAGNQDRNGEIIHNFLKRLKVKYDMEEPDKWYAGPYISVILDNLPRPQFLGLLKNCRCAVGNSSAFTYELPLINTEAKLIKIGERNKNRNPPNIHRHGSKKIAQILSKIPLDDLRRKRLLL